MQQILPSFMRNRNLSWLYRFHARSVRWGNTPFALERYSYRASIITVVITLSLLIVSRQTLYMPGFYVTVAAAVILFMVVDIASITFALSLTTPQQTQRDLLHITTIPPQLYVEARWQLVQTRTWRLLIVMQAIRLSLAIFLFIYGFWFIIFTVLSTFGAGILLFVLALAEPFWRVQSISAVGVYADAVGRTPRVRWLIGIGMMLAVWFIVTVLLLIPLFVLRFNAVGSPPVYFIFALPLITYLIRRLHITLRGWCLNRAMLQFTVPN